MRAAMAHPSICSPAKISKPRIAQIDRFGKPGGDSRSGGRTQQQQQQVEMKRSRAEEEVSLALSLSTDSSASDSSGATAAAKRARRRGPVVATSGEGDFVCKTCSRAFTSFQALGGHRTSHLRGRHGLDLGVGARALKQHKADSKEGNKARRQREQHECHVCGLGFEMGQALGGHMRRHREEMTGAAAAADWVWRPQELLAGHAAADPPVLLELFA